MDLPNYFLSCHSRDGFRYRIIFGATCQRFANFTMCEVTEFQNHQLVSGKFDLLKPDYSSHGEGSEQISWNLAMCG